MNSNVTMTGLLAKPTKNSWEAFYSQTSYYRDRRHVPVPGQFVYFLTPRSDSGIFMGLVTYEHIDAVSIKLLQWNGLYVTTHIKRDRIVAPAPGWGNIRG